MSKKLMNILTAAALATGLFTYPISAEDNETIVEETQVTSSQPEEALPQEDLPQEEIQEDNEADVFSSGDPMEELPMESEEPLIEDTKSEDETTPVLESQPVNEEIKPEEPMSMEDSEVFFDEDTVFESLPESEDEKLEDLPSEPQDSLSDEELDDEDEDLSAQEEEALIAMANEASTYASTALINVNVSMLSGLTVTSNPLVECDAAGNVLDDTSYTGTIEGTWNLIKLLEPAYNEYLKQEATAKPRTIFNKDSKQPSIQYTITVPEDQDVRFTNVTTTNSSAGLFSKVQSSIAGDGKSCTLTLDLPWRNYGEYFDLYVKAVANNPDASLSLTLTYEGNAAKGQDTASIANAIQNEGFGSFWYYKTWIFGKIESEVMRFTTTDGTNGKPLFLTQRKAGSQAEVTFQVENGTWQDGTTEPKSETVELTNGSGYLTRAQIPAGMIANHGFTNGSWVKEPTETEAITGAQTYLYRFEPMQSLTSTLNIKGDILIDGDTGHQHVIEFATKEEGITFTGTLDLSEMWKQLEEIEAQYKNNLNGQDIALKDIQTEFVASLSLPEQLEFVGGNANCELLGTNGAFEIASAQTDANTVTVTMKPTETIADFAKLKETLLSLNKTLTLQVANAKANAQALTETDYTAIGTFEGFFNATAVNPISGKEMLFDLTYHGVQSDEGKDVLYPSVADRLSISFRYKKEPALVEMTTVLGGDLRVNDETEHNAIYEVLSKDEEIQFTGMLDFSAVKKQMEEIEQQYGQVQAEKIRLDHVNSEFIATLTIPEELDYVATPRATLNGANSVFDCIVREVNGKQVIVAMRLVKPCATYAELKAALASVDDEITVTMSGVTANHFVEDGKIYTAEGMFTGTFSAKATNTVTQEEVNFRLSYTAKQLPESSDFAYPNDERIRFSFLYPEIMEVKATTEVEGDILVNDDTEHDRIYETTLLNGPLVFSGTLDLSKVLEQLSAIEAQYGQHVPADKIELRNLKSEYTAVLTLPDALDFVGTVQATLSGDQGGFKITKTEQVDAKTVKVTMAPRGDIENFAQLKKILTDSEEMLNVTLSGVEANDTMVFDTNYSVIGSFEGSLQADAANLISGKIIRFQLDYVAKQSADGADFIDVNNLDRLSCTVKYIKPAVIQSTTNFEADILVNNNTQNKEVYRVSSKADALTFVGVLNVLPIREQVAMLERQLVKGRASETVEFQDLKSEFVATLTLPEALDHNAHPTAEISGHNGGLEITGVKVEGKVVTVTMKVADHITTLNELHNVVDCADENLVITLSDVKANDKMIYDAHHTVVGTFKGMLEATAVNTANNEHTEVQLEWVGKQVAHGADSTKPSNLDNISCTVSYRKPTAPTPTKPSAHKAVPNTADNTQVASSIFTLISAIAMGALAMYVLRKQKHS